MTKLLSGIIGCKSPGHTHTFLTLKGFPGAFFDGMGKAFQTVVFFFSVRKIQSFSRTVHSNFEKYGKTEIIIIAYFVALET